MSEERLWLLVSLKLSGEAQPDELAELENLLEEYPDQEVRAQLLQTIWSARHKPSLFTEKETSFNKHMQRLSNHLSEPVLQYEDAPEEETAEDQVKPGRLKAVIKACAWVAGIAASLYFGWYMIYCNPFADESAISHNAQNTVSTKKGSKSKVQLPDGTQVWLNADSKITYNENFQGDLREVQLSGEAFFDVVRDEKRPFIIHTNVIDVRVLGTAFNVRSYADEKNTETSLIRGSVEVTLRNNPDKKFTLKPNEKITIDNKQAKEVKEVAESKLSTQSRQAALLTIGKVRYQDKDSSIVETLWVKNRLAFDAEPLEQMVLSLERWYDVKVKITDERLKKTEYTVTFEEESVKEVMEALQSLGQFHYEINKKEIIIRP